jgi:DNA-directed RNA polymerase subunit F
MQDNVPLESHPLPLFKVKEILSERKKAGELSYEQEQSLKYARTFTKLTKRKAETLFQNLVSLQSIDEKLATKIVDILPEDMDHLKLLVPKDAEVSEQDLEQALEFIRQIVAKKK